MTNDHTTAAGWAHAGLRPPADLLTRYHGDGRWRAETVLDDLRKRRADAPDSVAIFGYRDGVQADRLTWSQYASWVERYASGLRALGVGPGQVVVIQMPNWWQTSAMIIACFRVGAIAAPIMSTIRSRELERMLARLDTTVVVTVGEWAGFDHAAALAEMAPRLPHLRHRVVFGDAGADGETDFAEHFERSDWRGEFPMALADADEDPDRVALVLFTSGTSGEPKAIVHTFNTLSICSAQLVIEERIGPDDVGLNPHALTHIFGISTSILIPHLSGAAVVLMDAWSPAVACAVAAEVGVSFFSAAAVFVDEVLAEIGERAGAFPALRIVASGSTTIPPQLVGETIRILGVPLRTGWGMTEIPNGTWTRASDPADWGTRSDGRPGPAVELDLRADGEITRERPARLYVRGPGVCLATVGRDTGELNLVAARNDGWYDTGDLVTPDGGGGIRMISRAGDRIGGLFMIPAGDVESELLSHPDVADVALVGYPADAGLELACAVIVARTEPPTLDDLRAFLTARGMTEWYQPSRLEVLPALPRNATGKVVKDRLRRWLRGETAQP